MSASTVLPGRHSALSTLSTVDQDPYGDLEVQMAPICRSAVDTGEVAAHLEAAGVNDRIAARDYGVTSVFSLAARLRADIAGYPTAGAMLWTDAPAPGAGPAVTGRTCPECGHPTLIRRDGCDFCTSCGYTGACG